MATLEKKGKPSAGDGAGLWQSLEQMRIEPPGAAITFTAKLARDNSWDRQLAEAVVQEYRRFLYLAATGNGPVSPSQAVDKAWHLHLTYSRHYWDVLCGQILRRPLHHDPSLGGAAEDARHEDQYARTLALYRDTFGEEPPPVIWPVPGPRPRSGRAMAFTGSAAAMTLLGACAAVAATGAAPEEEGDGWIGGLLIFAMFLVVTFAVIRNALKQHRRRKRHASHDGCSSWGGDSNDSSDGGGGDSSCGGGCGGGD